MYRSKQDLDYYHNYRLIKKLLTKFDKYQLLNSYDEIQSKIDKIKYIEDEDFEIIPKGVIDYELVKKLAWEVFPGIIETIIQIHKHLVIHRDIKPENICFDEMGNAKIIDFSISCFVDDSYITNEPGGSIHFQAPELFQSGFSDGRKSDAWSVGIMLYVFLTNEFPFNSESELELQLDIEKNPVKFPQYFDVECKEILLKLLEKDPMKRYSLGDILKYFKNQFYLIDKLKQKSYINDI